MPTACCVGRTYNDPLKSPFLHLNVLHFMLIPPVSFFGSYITFQWVDDETPDNCVDNLIEGNVITNGIECVDIKEGSTENIVQGNFCSDQIDKQSGCFNIRGDDNIIRHDDFRKTLFVKRF